MDALDNTRRTVRVAVTTPTTCGHTAIGAGAVERHSNFYAIRPVTLSPQIARAVT